MLPELNLQALDLSPNNAINRMAGMTRRAAVMASDRQSTTASGTVEENERPKMQTMTGRKSENVSTGTRRVDAQSPESRDLLCEAARDNAASQFLDAGGLLSVLSLVVRNGHSCDAPDSIPGSIGAAVRQGV